MTLIILGALTMAYGAHILLTMNANASLRRRVQALEQIIAEMTDPGSIPVYGDTDELADEWDLDVAFDRFMRVQRLREEMRTAR